MSLLSLFALTPTAKSRCGGDIYIHGKLDTSDGCTFTPSSDYAEEEVRRPFYIEG